MAQVQPIIRIELDPLTPVPEICAVIMAVIPYHYGQEEALLLGIREAIEKRLAQLSKKGDEAGGK
ncbi:hypothetical protein [Paenibacillus alvei]|uniref:hypothetical protein n=1 Tax=Paenibacillus alvei TaxID=44250 RepID=UPI0018CE820A|nr:hypothetical protein [Paenibacillus alvei]MBG9737084.1 hypothetical protein [Paenibacillus alvei]MBG9742806.1 hypothetical protein [Paenibacillus alvei]MBG9746177.1 hypothetical protein [Paenibacillus alvei]MCY9579715.1 hypothetical protein [Paenibacillus alvei]MCY9586368.1 hypothetical protein [Paenibacillus alvei]